MLGGLLVAAPVLAGVPQDEVPATPAPALEAPQLLEFVEAPYPAKAEQERVEATVLLRLTLDAQGTVTEAEVLEPAGHGFDEAARDAALRFRFEPAKRNGVPVPSRIAYSYEFRLPAAAVPTAPVEDAVTPRAPGVPMEAVPAPVEGSAPERSPAPPATPAPAPEAAEVEPIEVTVEGESEAQRLRNSAESVRVIEMGQVQREAADLGQVLARTEGIGVRRVGGLGSSARFSLAGFTNEQIRFFIDGVPLELAGYGPEFANVPVNFVQRMEVYQGVVPVRFGADALGGAVQFVTSEKLHGTRVAASYELGSFDTHRLTLSGSHLHEPSGLFVRATGFYDSTPNDYRVDVEVPDELGRLVPKTLPRFHDAYRAGGGSVEAGFSDHPWARRLLLRAFASTTAKELQHGVTMDTPYGDVDSGSNSAGATLRYEQVHGQGLTTDAVGGYVFRRSQFTDVGTCAYDWFGRCVQQLPQPGEIESRAVERNVRQHTGFARFNVGWRPAADHVLRLAVAPTWVGRSGEDLALRARGEVDPLTGDRRILSLVTGLEYEHDALEGRLENIAFLKDYIQRSRADLLLPSKVFQPADQNLHHLGVGDSLRFRVSDVLTAKASYEWATRLPRPDELFGDGILYGENLLLRPERSHNVNVELAAVLPETAAGAFRGNVLGFARRVDDFIQPVGREGYFTYQNVIEARSLGVSGAAGWTSPGQWLTLDGNATFQDFRNISTEGPFAEFEGQRLPNRPHLLANGSARLQWTEVASPRDELSLSWHTRYIHSFFRSWERLGQGGSKQSIGAQLLHSLALTYVTRTSRATLSWTVDVQNLTDASAFDFMGVQRPGRTVAAKLVAEL
ncbi:TonB-dependent siderophore myxochelin receptor MxcH [Pyxidicoccus sp. MSG2]|uniref:TonB-dependent siderophore myxochelin receptor MxcH n=1 Tax=Pyxidicoccus sp. MSG2 TaxID=2996790 RepID=UPI002271607B|nr:TonB-dependent siderophore myxochelin receptor MxcH [Pyxidicoccus sp. MSG2]MCY1023002.1 TonB-dependent siderophore myxochelin receptor MxcH [Pyxidicoccus sp. MSG2]